MAKSILPALLPEHFLAFRWWFPCLKWTPRVVPQCSLVFPRAERLPCMYLLRKIWVSANLIQGKCNIIQCKWTNSIFKRYLNRKNTLKRSQVLISWHKVTRSSCEPNPVFTLGAMVQDSLIPSTAISEYITTGE